ncbi:flavin monoamine oxidase family protein [Lentzea kentuckyensis]|uniref:flavin monoamine oxidase family protein n=1 Tax=Lentzea kentuckyensis TaxID=360086 RepID=UPI001FE3F6EF|nr:NAD(P)/FAD-dependent oxidoreductase [Lentzea kentuckyensis]
MSENMGAGHTDRALSRRWLLKAGGLAAAATAVGTGTAAAQPSSKPTQYDAIVVGAGFAGAVAARQLRAAGLSTLVLEARNRIGGRTWTDTFAGQRIELGGQYVSSAQQLVTAELQRYRIATSTGLAATQAIMPAPGGFSTFTIEEMATRQGALLERMFAGTRDYFPAPHDPMLRRSMVAQIDGYSLKDRLDQLGFTPEERSWLSGTTAGQSGGSSSYGGMTSLMQWWALAGYSAASWYQAQGAMVSTGMSSLVGAILNEANAEVRLNTPVAAISESGGQVTVTTRAGTRITAKTVVVAVPVNLWSTISFSPGLPSVQSVAAGQGVGVRNCRKLWLHVRGLSEPVLVNGAEGDTFMAVVSHSTAADGGQLMFAINNLPALDVTSHSAVNAALQRVLPGTTLVGFRAQDWGADTYSRGGWALRKPGQMTAQLYSIQQPHGRLAFATSDIASGWAGFVEGALESGFRAATQAIALAR